MPHPRSPNPLSQGRSIRFTQGELDKLRALTKHYRMRAPADMVRALVEQCPLPGPNGHSAPLTAARAAQPFRWCSIPLRDLARAFSVVPHAPDYRTLFQEASEQKAIQMTNDGRVLVTIEFLNDAVLRFASF